MKGRCRSLGDKAQRSASERFGSMRSVVLPWWDPQATSAAQMGTGRSGAQLRSAAQGKAPQGWAIRRALINISCICTVLFCSLANSLM